MDSSSGNINFEEMQKRLQDHFRQTSNWHLAQQFQVQHQQRLDEMDTTSQDTTPHDTASHETTLPCEDNLQPLDFSTKKERSPSPSLEYSQRHKSSLKVSSRHSIESSSPSSSSSIRSPDSCSITPSSPNNYHHRLGSEMSSITQLPQFSHMSQLQRHENFLMTSPHKKESPSKEESPFKNSLSITPIQNLAPVDMGLHLQSNPNVAQFQALAAQNPLFVSAMCSMLGQKVAAEAQAPTQHNNSPPSTSPIPQFPFLGPQLGYQGAGPQLGFPGTIPVLNPIGVPPLLPPLTHNDNAFGNENYIKFRAEMYANGQIGGQPKSRRKQARSSQKEMRQQADSGNDYRSDDSSDKDEERRLKSDSKDTVKDEAYWEKRKKNNEAAKRSRDARRLKEEDTAVKAAFYERENIQLRLQLMAFKYELNNCEAELRARRASDKNLMV